MILASRTVVIKILSNGDRYIKRYYDEQKSINVLITESDSLEMTMSEKSRSEAVTNGPPLFSFGNNGDE